MPNVANYWLVFGASQILLSDIILQGSQLLNNRVTHTHTHTYTASNRKYENKHNKCANPPRLVSQILMTSN